VSLLAAARPTGADLGWFDALVLGVVQALTEFLPVSSSAHVSVVGQLIGREDPGAAFTAIVQLGTEAAVLLYFRQDIVQIARAWLRAVVLRREVAHAEESDVRLGWLVIVGSVPIVVLGLAFQDAIETTLRGLWITATMLIAFGVVIGVADATARTQRTLDRLTWRHGIALGFAQAMALVPGVSRSGGTIAAGLALGYTREAATRYSFLLAVPAVLGSGGYQLVRSASLEPPAPGPTALATLVSFILGYAVIAWLMRYITTHSYRPFVYYRIAAGLGIYGLLLAGVLSG
jgi:undecaprenyl-diphosphatase